MKPGKFNREESALLLLTGICILTWLVGWQIPLMEPDAAEYANISREMLLNKSFLQVFEQGRDYLDKPPMLFWLSSLSMRIFGISDAAYRFPSFLFSILSVYSAYRFALIYYSRKIALLSALVLAASQAIFLINHDVRTDTMLMGWVTLAIWQLAAWLENNKWKNLIFASIAIAGGMMTKGPIALMVPVFAFSMHFILLRSWASFFRWEYLVVLLIVAILLIPMSIGLYRQFDLHPEKIMYGRSGTSGLRFFYWTQSFGRITGESTWHENDDFFFLFENLLWGFLPWTVFFILGLISGFREWFRKKFFLRKGEEAISLGGFLITYCALGSSRAQLPHYIYVVLPLAAVITARLTDSLLFGEKEKKWLPVFSVVHYVAFALIVLAVFILILFPFPPFSPLLFFSALALAVFLLFILIRRWIPLPPLLSCSVMTILFVNIFLNTGFYPKLLQYQMSSPVSEYIRNNHLNKNQFFLFETPPSNGLDFYCRHDFKNTFHPDSLQKNSYLLTNRQGLETIPPDDFRLMDSVYTFHVSALTLPFLNPATRRDNCDMYYILQRL